MKTKTPSFIPFPKVFQDEKCAKYALETLSSILDQKKAKKNHFELLMASLVLNPEQFPAVAKKTLYDLYNICSELIIEVLLRSNKDIAQRGIEILGKVLRYESLQGWIHLDKLTPRHRVVDIYERLAQRESLKHSIVKELVTCFICSDPLIPIDVRGEVGELLVKLSEKKWHDTMQRVFSPILKNYIPLSVKSLKEHVFAGTDTIDVPFRFPLTAKRRMDVLWRASKLKGQERVFVDIMKVAQNVPSHGLSTMFTEYASKLRQIYEVKDNYLSHPEAERFIEQRLSSPIRSVEDYILNPNQKILNYTISDLTRIFSLSPETYFPDREVRTVWTAFSRSVLGFSKAANIGLGSKIVYISHGFDAPSLVYVGQAAVIGKGVTLDLTGGLVIGRRNYTSSFWSDAALHGHLHIGDSQRGVGGTLSRLGIEPYVLVFGDDIAFPPGVGYVEAAFYAQGEKYEGQIDGFKAFKAKLKRLNYRSLLQIYKYVW